MIRKGGAVGVWVGFGVAVGVRVGVGGGGALVGVGERDGVGVALSPPQESIVRNSRRDSGRTMVLSSNIREPKG